MAKTTLVKSATKILKDKKKSEKKPSPKKKDISAEYTYKQVTDVQPQDDDGSETDSENEKDWEPSEDEIGSEFDSTKSTPKVFDTQGQPVEPESLIPEGIGDSLPAYYDPLKRYIKDISRYALLAPEEELKLALQLRDTGDIESARRLVTANLRLVVKIAMEYRSAYSNVMDLIQEGNVGLMKAVSKFDPSKGAKLSYYASWWIRSYILKYILDNFRLVKIGTTQAQKKLFYQLMKEKDRLEALGLEGAPKLLAERLHVKEKEVVEMSQRLSGAGAEMSLQAPLRAGDESKASFQDMIEDPKALPEQDLELRQLKETLLAHLDKFAKTLKDKELTIFQERLNSDEPKTLQEIADKYGLTRERARQIEARVIEKMREYYQKYLR